MAKKSKGARETIKLRSTESPYVYSTKKNRRNTTGRMQLKKYDPVIRKHVLFKEEK
jgi:large subunit ribosomal protein L33